MTVRTKILEIALPCCRISAQIYHFLKAPGVTDGILQLLYIESIVTRSSRIAPFPSFSITGMKLTSTISINSVR